MANKRVLVCSVPCWNKKSGSDTFSSLLSGYDKDKIANLYIREELPDSEVCNNYFRISENAVIKSIFNKKIKTGKHIVTVDEVANDNIENEKVTALRYKKYSSKRNYFLLFARELLWYIGRWKTSELKEFLDDFKPEVVFFAMEGYVHFNRINRYILKYTGAKGIGYFWDDNFTYKQSKSLGHRLYRFFQKRDLKKSVKLCSDFFAITPKTKKEADDVFKIDSKVLTKPINFEDTEFSEYEVKSPIKILYTGKLIIGRYDTIKIIGEVLNQINAENVKMELDIYTTTYISEERLNGLSPFVHLLGAIPQNEIPEVQKQADILLFAEAISGKSSKASRLSFSTKLTDYFRSGKCILAVGNADIAPIEYLEQEKAAIIASDKKQLLSALNSIIENPEKINFYAKQAFECGRKNHNKINIEKLLFDTFNE